MVKEESTTNVYSLGHTNIYTAIFIHFIFLGLGCCIVNNTCKYIHENMLLNEHVAYKRGKPGQYGGTGNERHYNGCQSHERLLHFELSHMRERVTCILRLQMYIVHGG